MSDQPYDQQAEPDFIVPVVTHDLSKTLADLNARTQYVALGNSIISQAQAALNEGDAAKALEIIREGEPRWSWLANRIGA